jgi:pimeloyl-ACP methyl ester carboxylesterase
MPYFKHAGLRFHFEELGAGTPLVFQHGLGGDTAQPLGLLQPPAGVRLVAFDCRGHGQTPPGPEDALTFETMAADWCALLDHLGLAHAIAGGISLGAALALHLALHHPERVRALVLVRPAWLEGPLPEANRALYASLARLIRERGVVDARPAFTALPAFRGLQQESPAAAEAFLRQFDSEVAEAAVARLERLPAQAPHPRALWGALRVPALVVACRDDRLHPFELAQELAAGLPGAEFGEVASRYGDPARHAADVRTAIERFVAQHALID